MKFIFLFLVEFVKLSAQARVPEKKTRGAAGYDLFAAKECDILPGENALCFIDIAFKFPRNYYGRIVGRSGLTLHHKIHVEAGVIDNDYTGNIGVILFNYSDKNYRVNLGERIGQILFKKIISPDLIEVSEISSSERGEAGFGSTGI
jgi:dUTP pyrophosphatase